MISLTAIEVARFVSRRVAAPETCWEWGGYLDGKGYGAHWVKAEGKMLRAHHVAYFIAYGIRPKYILHECDNRKCVNPSHLAEGTHQENMRDASARGRYSGPHKTECSQGHPLAPWNTYVYGKSRNCVICAKKRAIDRNRRLKQ